MTTPTPATTPTTPSIAAICRNCVNQGHDFMGAICPCPAGEALRAAGQPTPQETPEGPLWYGVWVDALAADPVAVYSTRDQAVDWVRDHGASYAAIAIGPVVLTEALCKRIAGDPS